MEQTTMTETKTWRDYVDDRYYVYYVGYDDNLNGHIQLLQECVENNSLYPLSDAAFDWWDCPESEDMGKIYHEMTEDGLEGEFDEHEDEIRQWIFEHDESTPIEDLLGNTGEVNVFYSLMECDCYWVEAPFMSPYMAEQPETTADKICKLLNITKESRQYKQIVYICENASYGGELRIYWATSADSLISGDKYPNGTSPDWKTASLKGTYIVAVYNPNEGAGFYDYIELDVELPFIRSNLKLSEAERYNIEDCFGMASNWASGADVPAFSFDEPECAGIVKKSVFSERERRFEEVFKAGGCSVDDDNYSRHRDVYYRNDFPCGNVCPHCGHIWHD